MFPLFRRDPAKPSPRPVRQPRPARPRLEELEPRLLLDCSATIIEGRPFTGRIYSFGTDLQHTAGDFTAEIDWTDGTTSAGTVVQDRPGHFSVIGTHTYEHSAFYEQHVTVHDRRDGRTWTYGEGRLGFIVYDAPALPAGSVFSVVPDVPYDGPVATFFDTNPYARAENYRASVDWGVGQGRTEAIVKSVGGGHFAVYGRHTYRFAQPGTSGRAVVYVGPKDSIGHAASFSVFSTVRVTEAGSPQWTTQVYAQTVSLVRGQDYSGELFTIRSNDPAAAGGDYFSVQTDDAGFSPGPVVHAGGDVFSSQGTIDGAVECDAEPTFVVLTAQGDRVSVAGQVRRTPFTVTDHDFDAVEGEPVQNKLLATVRTTDPAARPERAVIDWGHGQPTEVVPQLDGSGGFRIVASKPSPYPYARRRTYSVRVQVFGTGDAPPPADVTAHVQDAPLKVTGLMVQGATAEIPFADLVVATFTDREPGTKAEDYRVTVVWDGIETSRAWVKPGQAGGFEVHADHTVSTAGLLPFKVSVTDASEEGGSTDSDFGGVSAVEPGKTSVPIKAEVNDTPQTVGTVEARTGDGVAGTRMAARFRLTQEAGPLTDCYEFHWLQVLHDPSGQLTQFRKHPLPTVDPPAGELDPFAGEPGDDLPWYWTLDEEQGFNQKLGDGSRLYPIADSPSLPAGTFNTWLVAVSKNTHVIRVLGGFEWQTSWTGMPETLRPLALGEGERARLEQALRNGGFDADGWQVTGEAKLDCRRTPTQRYVGAVYEDVLGRPVEAAGLAYWSSLLDRGTPRPAVAHALTHSPEYYATNVIRPAYLKFLGREADDGGLGYWVGRMQAGLTDEQLEAGFIGSPEYYGHAGGSDRAWVQAMYRDLLGRGPDRAGEDFWVGQLAAGARRDTVSYGFAASEERAGIAVRGYYRKFLGRDATDGEVAFWVGAFRRGTTQEDLVTGFVGSDEYYDRHTP